MMMNSVFDTNSIISAHLLPLSVTRQAYDKAFQIGVLYYSRATLNELSEVLLRSKFDRYISLEKRLEAIRLFQNRGYETDVPFDLKACRDPKDDKFLSLAVAAHAHCIVTGDKDLLELHPFQNIPIMTPAQFVSRY